MLILTRKPGESVMIEESVRITVLEVRGSQVKLGIQAPLDVRVNREEVLERQRAEAGLPPIADLPLPPVPRQAVVARTRRQEPTERPLSAGRGELRARSGRMRSAYEEPSPASSPRELRASRSQRSERSQRDLASGPTSRDHLDGRREPGRGVGHDGGNSGAITRDRGRPLGSRPAHDHDGDDLAEPVVRRYRQPGGPRAHRPGRLSERKPSPNGAGESHPEGDQDDSDREVSRLDKAPPGEGNRRTRRAGGEAA